MKLSDERKQWLREKLDEFKECHLMNFGDSRGWDVHGDLCDLLDDNAQLEVSEAASEAALSINSDLMDGLEADLERYRGIADSARRQLAEAEAENEALREYATHKPGCYEGGDKCICGLDTLLTGEN